MLLLIAMSTGILMWWLLYGLECYMNGSTDINRCLREEISWVLPGGRKRKADYIRALVGRSDHGWIGEFSYESIRRDNLYEVVGSLVLPGFWHFCFMHILIPLIPLLCYMGLLRHL